MFVEMQAYSRPTSDKTKMETIYDQPSVTIPEGHHWLSGVWLEIKNIGQKIKALQGRCMPEYVLQAAEHKEDVKVQSEENSSPQDPENQQPKNISEMLEKPRDVKRLQSDGRDDSFTGSRLRNRPTATKNISKKPSTNHQGYLLIALAFCTLPPGTYGDSGPVTFYRQINQSVNLPSGAKVEDVVYWFLSPAQNSADYFTLYASDEFTEIPKKHNCGGYQFRQNHSMFIASAQHCHAGTYTVEAGGDSRTMILIVNDVVANSTEKAKGNETLAPTTALNTESNSVNIVLAVVSTICCVLLLAIVVAIILYLTSKRKRNFNKVPAASYDRVRQGEDVLATRAVFSCNRRESA